MNADPDRIAVARLLLDQLGVTLDDLNPSDTTPTDQTSNMPTLAGYLPRVIAAAGPGANRTYGNYWRRMLTAWGDRGLDQIWSVPDFIDTGLGCQVGEFPES
jgi:hypothetical protein